MMPNSTNSLRPSKSSSPKGRGHQPISTRHPRGVHVAWAEAALARQMKAAGGPTGVGHPLCEVALGLIDSDRRTCAIMLSVEGSFVLDASIQYEKPVSNSRNMGIRSVTSSAASLSI